MKLIGEVVSLMLSGSGGSIVKWPPGEFIDDWLIIVDVDIRNFELWTWGGGGDWDSVLVHFEEEKEFFGNASGRQEL